MSSSTRLGTARELAGVGVCAHKRLGPTQTPKLVADMRLCGARRAMWCRTQRKWLSSVTLDRGSCSSTLKKKKEEVLCFISYRGKGYNISHKKPKVPYKAWIIILVYFLHFMGSDRLMVLLCVCVRACMWACAFGRRWSMHACMSMSSLSTYNFDWYTFIKIGMNVMLAV